MTSSEAATTREAISTESITAAHEKDKNHLAVPTRDPNDQEVTIRMYTHGLGDCFLVSFNRSQGDKFYMVIDCGVFRGTEKATDKMVAVVESIEAATNGHIHLLVVTHEHWDHLSGFVQAFDVWERISIDEIWLSWVAKPGDEDGQRLCASMDAQLVRLRQAVRGMEARFSSTQGARIKKLKDILDFFGEQTDEAGSGAPISGLGVSGAGRPGRKSEIMDYLRNRVDARVTYHEPGEVPYSPPDVPGVRFYVLGPPRDATLLAKEDPSKVESEVYQLEKRLRLADSFATALPARDSDGTSTIEDEDVSRSSPFESYYRVDPKEVITEEYKKNFPNYAAFFSSYGYQQWRTINEDWLSVSEQLALNLDNVVNNTSLVLAVELLNSKKVLLFVADAQVGNWLSWEKVKWRVKEGDRIRLVTGPDLLARTVFYKVGHHGSHNATLQAKGLELMAAGGDLVAMIPVDHDVVESKGWKMPFDHMLNRLKEKTRGRVVIAYEGLPNFDAIEPSHVREAFKGAIRPREDEPPQNYVEFTLRG